MRVNLRWLNEYVRVDVPVKKLSELLSMSGLKVEGVHRREGGLPGVVVAEVLDKAPHPNADTLTLVDVSIGDGDAQRVVCGADNYSVGDRVPLATVGARLGDVEIAERKIRGETSRGMLCSAAELEIARDHGGIFIMPSDAPLGEEVGAVLDLDAPVLELEVTPNRPDCMGMIGIAREVSALLGNELTIPPIDAAFDDSLPSPVGVDIADPTGCVRYVARYLEDVRVGPSPVHIVKRLLSVGIRPILNVVDITNYVMLETGQPLHAFDATKVDGHGIVVRRASRGERLVTLDGSERALHPDDLLIADRSKPLAMAGLMGGADSEVSDATTSVVIESATFDPATVAYMSRRHFLRTEASGRFERGSDPEGALYAAARAAQLMASYAGARVATQVSDAYPTVVDPVRLRLRPRRTNAIVGTDIRADLQASKLRSIGLDVVEEAEALAVTVPTFRPDLKREIDLVEEVVRLVGFDSITSTIPPGRSGALTERQAAERKLKATLVGLGLREAWTSAFASDKDFDDLGLPADHPARSTVKLANPMTADESSMRTTLLPALLRSVARNFAHRSEGASLFEVARVFEPTGGELPQEAPVVAAVCGGLREPQRWDSPEQAWDFFSLKGVLEGLFAALRVEGAQFIPVGGAPFHPTRAARVQVGEVTLGAIGEIHPDVCDRFDVPQGTVALELAVAALFASLPGRPRVGELPKFPPILIDLAVVVDEDVPADRLQRIIGEAGGPEVTGVRLFDLYRGDQIPPGKKSLAYALELRSPEKTMTDEEAAAVRDRVISRLAEQTGAQLRS
ncbi:MAG: phenylalanine--tRNA ligase subunit beta [Actinomycetota bacterium]|nr:phenylalanine--tRNA ligase subunit beta [Actinomycetota bacterium]